MDAVLHIRLHPLYRAHVLSRLPGPNTVFDAGVYLEQKEP